MRTTLISAPLGWTLLALHGLYFAVLHQARRRGPAWTRALVLLAALWPLLWMA